MEKKKKTHILLPNIEEASFLFKALEVGTVVTGGREYLGSALSRVTGKWLFRYYGPQCKAATHLKMTIKEWSQQVCKSKAVKLMGYSSAKLMGASSLCSGITTVLSVLSQKMIEWNLCLILTGLMGKEASNIFLNDSAVNGSGSARVVMLY